jgi:hypothetical protein
MKILCIGNSFSQDTTRVLPQILEGLGMHEYVVGNLYIGGCPIHKHYENFTEALPAYTYFRNDGRGWTQIHDTVITHALVSEKWDWVCIQHGSSYGGFYTEEESYALLPALVEGLRSQTTAKIAFNLTWVGVPEHDRPEMIRFRRDQVRYFNAICDTTQRVVATIPGIERVCPTGTAVQNARKMGLAHRLCRDGYHLSMGPGCYLAGMTFLKALTGCALEPISWVPEDVSGEEKAILIAAANQAIEQPYNC